MKSKEEIDLIKAQTQQTRLSNVLGSFSLILIAIAICCLLSVLSLAALYILDQLGIEILPFIEFPNIPFST